MPRKKPAVAAAQPAASRASVSPSPASTPSADAERPLFPWLTARLALPTALLFIAIGIARIVSTYHNFASTSDEPAHIACGLEYVANHVYKYETQHPPLSRAFIALLPYFSGTRPRGNPTFQLEGWDLITYEKHPDATMTRMRLGVLPFFVLAALVTYFWTLRYFGPTAAVIATALFTMIPTVLAHSGLATTDMALTSCVGLAFFLLLRWAEQPSMGRAAAAGFGCGLAALAKYTSLGYVPAAVALALVAWFAATRPPVARVMELVRQRAAGLGIIARDRRTRSRKPRDQRECYRGRNIAE